MKIDDIKVDAIKIEEGLVDLIKHQTDKIKKDLNSPFYLTGSFWTSFLSAIIAVASASFVYVDTTYGGQKRLNAAIAIEQKNKLELTSIEMQVRSFSAEKNNYEQGLLLSQKLKEIGKIGSLEKELKHTKETVLRLNEEINRSNDIDSRLKEAKSKIDQLNTDLAIARKNLEDRPIEKDITVSESINLSKNKSAEVFDALTVTLMRVGNYKLNADFYYTHSSDSMVHKVLNLDVGDAIAKEIGKHIFIIKVVSTINNPDSAELKITKVKVK